MNPQDRRYSREHEWVKSMPGAQALLGITAYAQEQLGDIVYLSLPEEGANLTRQQKMGEIESVKAVSDVFSPIGGVVVEVNQKATDSPELVNQDPYGEGWLVKVSVADHREIDALMTAEQYDEFLKARD